MSPEGTQELIMAIRTLLQQAKANFERQRALLSELHRNVDDFHELRPPPDLTSLDVYAAGSRRMD